MKATCEILEVKAPVSINRGGEDVPVVQVFVRTIETRPSSFILSIWGDNAIRRYNMKRGEYYRIEFVIKGQYCQDGQFRVQYFKLIHAKRKVIDDYLYIIVKTGSDAMKVGRSVDPERRLEELQTSSDTELFIYAQYEKCGLLESMVHNQLKKEGYHIKGEWFKYVPDALKIVDNACNW